MWALSTPRLDQNFKDTVLKYLQICRPSDLLYYVGFIYLIINKYQ